jgi:16S rRNA U1498 N3-methylase RsmE
VDIRRFFCENDVNDAIIEIDGEEAYHLKKVLRVKIGNLS